MTTIEVHVIQTLPPSRVNRGEDGHPKTVMMGGVQRLRISSQSMKATQRDTERTRRTKVPHELVERALNVGTEARLVIMDVLAQRYGAYDERQRLKAMVYLDDTEVAQLAECIRPMLNRLTSLQEQVTSQPKDKGTRATYDALLVETLADYAPGMSEDLALYGRFIAEASTDHIVAATSYGHAISTHRENMTADFFSAVDHVTGESAHIGTQRLAAPTLYRFASLDVGQLRRNLDSEPLGPVIRRWIHGFMLAVPEHGRHGAAAATLPEHVLLLRRDGGHAVTLANAFAEPAYPAAGESLVAASIRRLHDHLDFTERVYSNGRTTSALVSAYPHLVPSLTASRTLDEAIGRVLELQ